MDKEAEVNEALPQDSVDVVPKDEFKKVVAQRQEYKGKLSEIEAELNRLKQEKQESETKRLQEEGRYKDLYEQLAKEKAELGATVEKLTPLQEKYKKTILSKLPAELQSKHAESDVNTIEMVLEVYEQVAPKQVQEPTGRVAGRFTVNDNSKWEDYNSTQLAEIKKSNPDKYWSMYNKKFRK